MAAPKYIKDKAEQLDRALNKVAKLAFDLESWYESKTDTYAANEFFSEEHLDNPYEFDLDSVLEALDKAADGKAQYRKCY